MAGIGTLTVQSLTIPLTGEVDVGAVIELDILQFTDGFPHADPSWVVEPITAMGVNYSRLRLVRKEYVPFTLRCMAGYPTYAAAVADARLWRQMVGHLSTLRYTAGGTLYTLAQTMYVGKVVAAPRAGYFVGANLNNTSPCLAYVEASFDLQFVQT